MIIDLLKEQQYMQYVNYTNDKKIVFKESNSKYIAKNKNGKYVYKLKIDKGMINDIKNKKCDYGLYLDSENVLILIELKGKDINYAFKQVTETYKWLYCKANDTSIIMKVRVMTTHVNRIFDVGHERKKLIKIAKWKINIEDIIVREKYEDMI